MNQEVILSWQKKDVYKRQLQHRKNVDREQRKAEAIAALERVPTVTPTPAATPTPTPKMCIRDSSSTRKLIKL